MHHARDVDKAGGAATAAATPEEHVAPAVVVATVVGGGGTGGTGDTGALETYPTVLTGGTGLYRLWLMEKAVQTLAWCSASTSSHAAPQYHSPLHTVHRAAGAAVSVDGGVRCRAAAALLGRRHGRGLGRHGGRQRILRGFRAWRRFAHLPVTVFPVELLA